MSTYSVSKTIFEIKVTEDKSNISTPMLSGSGKNPYTLVLWLKAPRQKVAVVVSFLIPAQVYQEVLIFYHQQGGAIRDQ